MAETRELSRVLASGRSANAGGAVVAPRAAIIDRSIEDPAGFRKRTRNALGLSSARTARPSIRGASEGDRRESVRIEIEIKRGRSYLADESRD